MKINISFCLALCFFLVADLFGQSDVDALRYSTTRHTGTARSMSMAGSFGAAGADFSSLSGNPAGLGLYRSSQAMITFKNFLAHTNSEFDNQQFKDSRNSFTAGNFGVVFSKLRNQKPEERLSPKWRALNFGIGFNQMANYAKEFSFNGLTRGTIAEYYVASATGNTEAQLRGLAGLAYQTGIIYQEPFGSTNYTADLDAYDTVQKQLTSTSRGRINEVDFSVGGNYNDKLYVGATVGVSLLEYSETTNYQEEDRLEIDSNFINLEQNVDFISSGAGLNLKLGAIYRIQPWLRAGVSINSPTRYNLSDDYFEIMYSTLLLQGSIDSYQAPIEEFRNIFDYKLTTAWKPMVSIAAFIKKKGFINLDVEWANYKGMRLNFGDEDPSYAIIAQEINDLIRAKYRGAFNIRLGGEYAKERFRVRGGYAIHMSPFSKNVLVERRAFQQYTGGLGYYFKRVHLDLAYVLGRNGESYVPYDVTDSPNTQLVKNEQYDHSIALTIGVRFSR